MKMCKTTEIILVNKYLEENFKRKGGCKIISRAQQNAGWHETSFGKKENKKKCLYLTTQYYYLPCQNGDILQKKNNREVKVT